VRERLLEALVVVTVAFGTYLVVTGLLAGPEDAADWAVVAIAAAAPPPAAPEGEPAPAGRGRRGLRRARDRTARRSARRAP